MLNSSKILSPYYPFGDDEEGSRPLPTHALGILGARGSTVVSGEQFTKYGGATTSFVMDTADPTVCIAIDAGTGILHHDFSKYSTVHIFFTHMHLDHILGLLYLPLFYSNHTTIHLYVPSYYGFNSFADMISPFLATPYFPVVQDAFSSKIVFHSMDIPEDGSVHRFCINEVDVLTRKGNHPGGCVMYRLNIRGKGSHCFTGDYEHNLQQDAELIEFAQNADFLIYDSSYTQEDYIANYIGWGHSTHEHAVDIAKAAGIKYLILTHHNHTYNDKFLDTVLRNIRKKFPNTCFAYTGLYLELLNTSGIACKT